MDDAELQKYINLGLFPKFPFEIIDSKNDVELSIGIENRKLYIAFLGSATMKDWLHDFMFWKKPYKDMKNVFFVHAGFLKVYKIVRDKINSFLVANQNSYDSIFISGHSLGGAVATLCYEDIQYMKENGVIKDIPVNCITSGTPRVFGFLSSKVLKERMKDKVSAIYKNDGVTSLPPVILGYKHFGKIIKSGKRSVFGILVPSFVYNHDRRGYKTFAITDVKDNEENNKFYGMAVKTYKIIYISTILIAGLALVLLM